MAGLDTKEHALNVLKAHVPANTRQSWSSTTLDGNAVVGQFWTDQFVTVPQYGAHRFYIGEAVSDFGKDGPGFRQWRDRLNWAWENNRRLLVVEVAREPRKFVARPDIVMKLIALDQETGAYVAREEPAAVTKA